MPALTERGPHLVGLMVALAPCRPAHLFTHVLQDPNARPSFKEVKARLVAFSQATFHCTAAEALARKRASEKRLIDQMLPQKVSHWLHIVCST